jgi:hypothetical protein
MLHNCSTKQGHADHNEQVQQHTSIAWMLLHWESFCMIARMQGVLIVQGRYCTGARRGANLDQGVPRLQVCTVANRRRTCPSKGCFPAKACAALPSAGACMLVDMLISILRAICTAEGPMHHATAEVDGAHRVYWSDGAATSVIGLVHPRDCIVTSYGHLASVCSAGTHYDAQ